LLTEGEVSLLAREKLVTETCLSGGYGGPAITLTFGRVSAGTIFWALPMEISGVMTEQKRFLYLLKDKSGEVKKFANTNRLRFDDKRDLVQIVNYYNSLKK
jgi:hypothetical protein